MEKQLIFNVLLRSATGCNFLSLLSYRHSCSKTACTLHDEGSNKYLLELLHPKLRMEFPDYLRHRSGISKRLEDLLRALVQNSVGLHRNAGILQELYMLKQDRLALCQFLQKNQISKRPATHIAKL